MGVFGKETPSEQVIALSILAAAEVAHAFSAHMPSAFTIKSFALQGTDGEVKEKLSDLRSGYLPATIFGLLLSGVVAVLAKSPLPLMFGGGAAAVMVMTYESNLPKEMRLGNGQKAIEVPKRALPWGVSGV